MSSGHRTSAPTSLRAESTGKGREDDKDDGGPMTSRTVRGEPWKSVQPPQREESIERASECIHGPRPSAMRMGSVSQSHETGTNSNRYQSENILKCLRETGMKLKPCSCKHFGSHSDFLFPATMFFLFFAL